MQIIPIKDLKNTGEMSALCNNTGEPVFITKNGYGDMVLMSLKTYEEQCYAGYVRRKLAEAERSIAAGDRGEDYKTVIDRLIAKNNEKINLKQNS